MINAVNKAMCIDKPYLILISLTFTFYTGCAAAAAQSPPPRYVVCRGESADKSCGVIDEFGTLKIPMELSSVRGISDFSEGRAILRNEVNREGWIDTEGATVIEATFADLFFPSEGLAYFYRKEDSKCGYIDLTGKEVIEAQWDLCGEFKEGRSIVVNLDKDGESQRGYINKEGKVVVNLQYDESENFSDGRARVKLSPSAPPELIEKLGSKYGYIDRDGNPITQFDFDRAAPFENGMAMVFRKVGERVWDDEYSQGVEELFEEGFINLDGELVWPMEFETADFFNEAGFARAELCEDDDCESGIIDKDGGWKFRPGTYEYIASFSEGLAFVETHEGWKGYVDGQGNKVFAASSGHAFVNGVADVDFWFSDERDACGSSGLVDTKGEYIFPFRVAGAYTTDRSFDENQIMVADIFAKGTDYHEIVLHRERGVIWPPGWNEPGAGEGVLCWPELEAKKKGASPSELEGE